MFINKILKYFFIILFEKHPFRKFLLNWTLKQFNSLGFLAFIVSRNPDDRILFLNNLFNSILKRVRQDTISYAFLFNFFLFLVKTSFIEKHKKDKFYKNNNYYPPSFLVISLTNKCNLKCFYCYANSTSREDSILDPLILFRVLKDARKKWGCCFTIITGGEPFLYNKDNYNIFALSSNNTQNFFFIFTNATLINEDYLGKIKKLKNISPTISIEGSRELNNQIRGNICGEKIESASILLQESGIMWGYSITASKLNYHILKNENFYKNIFAKGCWYLWILDYSIQGRAEEKSHAALAITEKKDLVMMWEKLRKECGYFIVSFLCLPDLNGGCSLNASYDRFFHMDHNGDIKKCVFNERKISNIYDLYKHNRDLDIIIKDSYFNKLRNLDKKDFKQSDERKVCPIPGDI